MKTFFPPHSIGKRYTPSGIRTLPLAALAGVWILQGLLLPYGQNLNKPVIKELPKCTHHLLLEPSFDVNLVYVGTREVQIKI